MEQNQHWETDWMADREKAFSEEKNKQIQIEIQKQNDLPQPKPKKSKKSKKAKKKSKKSKKSTLKSSSGSSSESDSVESDHNNGIVMDDNSKSIRVAMRNKNKPSQPIQNDDKIGKFLLCDN